jgi:hypothetical protein
MHGWGASAAPPPVKTSQQPCMQASPGPVPPTHRRAFAWPTRWSGAARGLGGALPSPAAHVGGGAGSCSRPARRSGTFRIPARLAHAPRPTPGCIRILIRFIRLYSARCGHTRPWLSSGPGGRGTRAASRRMIRRRPPRRLRCPACFAIQYLYDIKGLCAAGVTWGGAHGEMPSRLGLESQGEAALGLRCRACFATRSLVRIKGFYAVGGRAHPRMATSDACTVGRVHGARFGPAGRSRRPQHPCTTFIYV